MTGVSKAVLPARTNKPNQFDNMLRVILLGPRRFVGFAESS